MFQLKDFIFDVKYIFKIMPEYLKLQGDTASSLRHNGIRLFFMTFSGNDGLILKISLNTEETIDFASKDTELIDFKFTRDGKIIIEKQDESYSSDELILIIQDALEELLKKMSTALDIKLENDNKRINEMFMNVVNKRKLLEEASQSTTEVIAKYTLLKVKD